LRKGPYGKSGGSSKETEPGVLTGCRVRSQLELYEVQLPIQVIKQGVKGWEVGFLGKAPTGGQKSDTSATTTESTEKRREGYYAENTTPG